MSTVVSNIARIATFSMATLLVLRIYFEPVRPQNPPAFEVTGISHYLWGIAVPVLDTSSGGSDSIFSCEKTRLVRHQREWRLGLRGKT
ncbi:uncharacterized protein CIMG_10740 [Coccidioides immitis RS]|uniref:Uncharacterized protein n=1 Tax=Coccidioides immitis (strain RS) TaxID=246410 RepID=A0A0D8JT94_COCIM|nr:uncharacterized protein CIMG_10740 [Coccidioides immitis RS]KJF60166.1 hypothetical protein CIMG_10740 [Coccidioides immitis RS]